MEEDTTDQELIQDNFIGKKPEPETSTLKIGVVLVLLFWATFGISWLFISSNDSGAKLKVDFAKLEDNLGNISSKTKSATRILGLTSKWDADSATEYLASASERLKKPSQYSVLVSTYSASQNGTEENSVHTLSSEYDSKAKLAYLTVTSLEGKNTQYVISGDNLYSRNTSYEKWSQDTALLNADFSVNDASGQKLLSDLYNIILPSKKAVFKGIEEKDDAEVLRFNVSLDEKFFNENLKSEGDEFFGDLSIDFWVNPETNKTVKLVVITKNLFIGENQFATKNTFEYIKSTSSSSELKEIVPDTKNINTTEKSGDLSEILVRVFRLP